MKNLKIHNVSRERGGASSKPFSRFSICSPAPPIPNEGGAAKKNPPKFSFAPPLHNPPRWGGDIHKIKPKRGVKKYPGRVRTERIFRAAGVNLDDPDKWAKLNEIEHTRLMDKLSNRRGISK